VTEPLFQIPQRDRLAEARRLVVHVEILDLGMAPAALEQQENLGGGLEELVGADAVGEGLQIPRVAGQPVDDDRTAADEARVVRGKHVLDEVGIAGGTDLRGATPDQGPEDLVTRPHSGRTLKRHAHHIVLVQRRRLDERRAAHRNRNLLSHHGPPAPVDQPRGDAIRSGGDTGRVPIGQVDIFGLLDHAALIRVPHVVQVGGRQRFVRGTVEHRQLERLPLFDACFRIDVERHGTGWARHRYSDDMNLRPADQPRLVAVGNQRHRHRKFAGILRVRDFPGRRKGIGGVWADVIRLVIDCEFEPDAFLLKLRPLEVRQIGAQSDRIILGDDIGAQLNLDLLDFHSHLILL
jgi:hypothetical protein